MGLISYKNVNPQTTPQFRSVGVGPIDNRNSQAVGVNSAQQLVSPPIQPRVSSPSSSSLIFDEINAYNRDVAEFIEEDDLDRLKLRSGNI